MSRPTTAVTNSAVESASTRRISHVAGTTVRYGSTPKPTTIQATTHRATRATGWRRSRGTARAGRRQDQPDDPPSRAPRTRM